jgi:DNA-binding IclR family transcriptional regulator
MPEAVPRKGDRQVVTALVRGLALLRAFSSARPQLSGTELATITGLPQPTVWRLCHTMERLGFLDRVGGDLFRPGLPVRGLAQALLATLPIPGNAAATMRGLGEATGAAVELALRDGTDLVIVQTWFPDAQLMVRREVGDHFVLSHSDLGWGYLAGLDSDARAALLQELALPQRWSGELTRMFARAMQDADAAGAVVSIGLFQPGYNSAVAPIGGALPGYVLTCSGPAINLPPGPLRKAAVPRLVAAAAALASRSGSGSGSGSGV